MHGPPVEIPTMEIRLNPLWDLVEEQTKEPAVMVVVDKGYLGRKIEKIKIYFSGVRRKCSSWFKAPINRRQSIEPRIGHMKSDGHAWTKLSSRKAGRPIKRMALRNWREFTDSS